MDNKADVVFVTELEVSGFMNGVINLAFSTAQFVPQLVPNPDHDATAPDEPPSHTVVAHAPVITANLRMDLRLAQIVRDRLDQIIGENTRPVKAAN
jgi:hypothetical protein